MKSIFERLVPFLFLGIMIVIFVAGLIIFSYLLIAGAIVGLVIFTVLWIREKFFPTKFIVRKESSHKKGRIIDHEK